MEEHVDTYKCIHTYNTWLHIQTSQHRYYYSFNSLIEYTGEVTEPFFPKSGARNVQTDESSEKAALDQQVGLFSTPFELQKNHL